MKTLLIFFFLFLSINNLYSQSTLKDSLDINNEEELEFNSYGIFNEVDYQNANNEYQLSYLREYSAESMDDRHPDVIQVLLYLRYKFEGSKVNLSAGEYFEMKVNEYLAQKEVEKSNNKSNKSNKIYLQEYKYSSKMGYNSYGVLEPSFDCIYENGEVLTIGAALFASKGCSPYIIINN
jgi:hypothetical protein|tara:strand:+ start:425 stop:961 length:537 start_codon:yes stop_codon:yes gene_type:complete